MEIKPSVSEEDLRSGTWVVAIPTGIRSLIGRVHLLDLKDPYDLGEGKKKASLSVEEVLGHTWMTLWPVFDFFNITLRPVPVIGENGRPMMGPHGTPEMAMQRDPIMNAHEFYREQRVPAHVNLRTCFTLEFFSQMGDKNIGDYKEFLKHAIQGHARFTEANSPIQAPTDKEREAIERGHGGRRS